MKVYLGLGTNLGDKEQNLRMSVHQIEERVGNVVSLSAFYVTEPWGFDSGNSFLNAVVCADTNLSPMQLLHETQAIERELGRTKKSLNRQYSDRLIDIDILLYGSTVMNTEELILPHPLMTKRKFVIEPLAEIAPELVHPILHQSIKTLMNASFSSSADVE